MHTTDSNEGDVMEFNYIIKALMNKASYNKFRPSLVVLEEQIPVINLLDKCHSQTETDVTISELKIMGGDDMFPVVEAINQIDVSNNILSEAVKTHLEKVWAYKQAMDLIDVYEGRKQLSDALHMPLENKDVLKEMEDHIITTDLDVLLEETDRSGGLLWRMPSLNEHIGGLHKGDFGIIFARPESFSRDTEVLTPSGWLRVDAVTEDTHIGQVDSSRKLSFVKPLGIYPHEQERCIHIHDSLGRVDLIVTQGHAMVVEKNGQLTKERADTVKYCQGVKHHVSAPASLSEEVDFLPEHRLAIAYQADGHTRNYKEYGYTFSFKKKRKQERIKEIAAQCGFPISEYKDGNRGHLGYYVKANVRLHKDFDWVDLSVVSQKWCQEFIEELSYWDATRRTDTRFKFDTTDKTVADKVQAIAILAGYNCLISVHIDDRKPTYSDIYSLSIRTQYVPVDGQCIEKEEIPFTDTTYCFKVPTGMLLVRRNGAVAVCGNTGKTTFLTSEVGWMTQHTTSPVIHFNNEERGVKVMMRYYESIHGVSRNEIRQNKSAYSLPKETSLVLFDKAKITRRDVERLIKEVQPSLIVFDQIDKIVGFSAERADLAIRKIYIWAREIAKEVCPVIGVCQAAGSAENKKWLEMDDMAESKTAKPAEADFIIGIGKIAEGYENTRFIHLVKNKLTGSHAKITCLIEPQIGRYKDIE